MLRTRHTGERQASVLLHHNIDDNDDKKTLNGFHFKNGKSANLINKLRYSKPAKMLKPLYSSVKRSATVGMIGLSVAAFGALVILYFAFVSVFSGSSNNGNNILSESKSVQLSGIEQRAMMKNLNTLMTKHANSALHTHENSAITASNRFCLDLLNQPLEEAHKSEAGLNLLHFVNSVIAGENLGYEGAVITPSGGVIDPTNTDESAEVISQSQHCPYLDTIVQISKSQTPKQAYHNKEHKDAFDQHYDTIKMKNTVKSVAHHFDAIEGECKDATADMSAENIEVLTTNVLQSIYEIVDTFENEPNKPHPAKEYYFDKEGNMFHSEAGAVNPRLNTLRRCRYLETFLNDPTLHIQWKGASTRDLVTFATQTSQHIESLLKGTPPKEEPTSKPIHKSTQHIQDPLTVFQTIFSYNGACRKIPAFLGSDAAMNTLSIDLLNAIWHATDNTATDKQYYISKHGHILEQMPMPTAGGEQYDECPALDDLLNNNEIRKQWISEYSLATLLPQVLVKSTPQITIDTSKDALVTLKTMLAQNGECSNLAENKQLSEEAAKDLAINTIMKVWSPQTPSKGFYGVNTKTGTLTYSETDNLSSDLKTCKYLNTILTSSKVRNEWTAKESSAAIVQRLVSDWDGINTGLDIQKLLSTKEPGQEIKNVLTSGNCGEATSQMESGQLSDLVINVISSFWMKNKESFDVKHHYYFDNKGSVMAAGTGELRCDDLDTLMNSLDVHNTFTSEHSLTSAISSAVKH